MTPSRDDDLITLTLTREAAEAAALTNPAIARALRQLDHPLTVELISHGVYRIEGVAFRAEYYERLMAAVWVALRDPGVPAPVPSLETLPRKRLRQRLMRLADALEPQASRLATVLRTAFVVGDGELSFDPYAETMPPPVKVTRSVSSRSKVAVVRFHEAWSPGT